MNVDAPGGPESSPLPTRAVPERSRHLPPTVLINDSHIQPLVDMGLLPPSTKPQEGKKHEIPITSWVSTILRPNLDKYVPANWREKIDPVTGEVLEAATANEIHEVRSATREAYKRAYHQLRAESTEKTDDTKKPVLREALEDYHTLLSQLRRFERSGSLPSLEITSTAYKALKRIFAAEVTDPIFTALCEQLEQFSTSNVINNATWRAERKKSRSDKPITMEELAPLLETTARTVENQVALCRGVYNLFKLATSQEIPLEGRLVHKAWGHIVANLQGQVGLESSLTNIQALAAD